MTATKSMIVVASALVATAASASSEFRVVLESTQTSVTVGELSVSADATGMAIFGELSGLEFQNGSLNILDGFSCADAGEKLAGFVWEGSEVSLSTTREELGQSPLGIAGRTVVLQNSHGDAVACGSILKKKTEFVKASASRNLSDHGDDAGGDDGGDDGEEEEEYSTGEQIFEVVEVLIGIGGFLMGATALFLIRKIMKEQEFGKARITDNQI